MKLRSWWFFILWLSAGIVGAGLLFPDFVPVGLFTLGTADKAMFEQVATALPDEADEFNAASASPSDEVEAAQPVPIVLKEGSPSDHGAGMEEVFGAAADDNWNAVWSGDSQDASGSEDPFADVIGDSFGAGSGGLGMSGTGRGGGGTGIGSIGTGSIGTIGYGSGAGRSAAPPRLPTATSAKMSAPPSWDRGEDEEDNLIGSAEPPGTALAEEPSGGGVRSTAATATESSDADTEFDDILDEIDRKLARLPLGNIAFNAPETIPLGEMATIELVVSLTEAEEVLREAVRAPGPIETAAVHVSPYMEAQLSGVGFTIESATPAKQLLSRSERTRWRWQIEPNKADTLELTLTLSALFSVAGEERTRAIRTFEKTIVVDVSIKRRVAHFVSNNQEWLGTALVIPILGAVYRIFRKRRRPASSVANEMDRRAA